MVKPKPPILKSEETPQPDSSTKEKKELIHAGKTKLFHFKGQDGKQYSLTIKEKKFAEEYLANQGNGTQAILEAGYDCTNSRGDINYNLAASMAREYLQKPHIYLYITSLLEKYGFADENVERQHMFLINQFADLGAKGKGIDMFYKVRGKYPKDQVEISLVGKYKTLSDKELEQIVEGEVLDK